MTYLFMVMLGIMVGENMWWAVRLNKFGNFLFYLLFAALTVFLIVTGALHGCNA